MAVTTIVFGPTGGVGNFAARYVGANGGKVVLAMRDTSKAIPGLDAASESKGSFTRVKADLSDASSVLAAVKETKPDSAFIYNIQGPGGTPKESIQALKDGGVKRLVLLSSYSVSDPIDAIPQSEFISYHHGQKEKAAESIFGEGNYTAIRPAWFASNSFRYIPQIKTGVVREIYPTNVADFIAPKDIGEVAGALLLRETGPLPRVVDLTGQQVVEQGKALKMCAAAAGRDIKVEHIEREEGVKAMIEAGIPEPVANFLGNMQVEMHQDPMAAFSGPRFDAGQKNVKEYLGRDGTTLEQWIEENKAAFA